MKIGIMTMHRIPNYGSILQALSLKRMIEALGHEVCFVDYRVQPEVEKRNDIRDIFYCWLKNQKAILRGTWIGKTVGMKSTIPEIWTTRNGILGITDKYAYRTKVDVLVIGSDEVFNCLQPGYNIGYSLELFGKRNRAGKVFTYAASFGSTTLPRLEQYGVCKELGDLLDQMQAISVRDLNSAQITQAICGKKPEIHLDPVLVGSLETYKWPVPELKDYVVLYGYHNRFSEQECRDILQWAHGKGKTVVALGEAQLLCDCHILCRPEEVIGYFQNADFVFTDTFHGTIFSVITHKQFLTVCRSGQAGNREKLTSLVADLGLENRLVTSFDSIDSSMHQPIDYEKTDALRATEREKALEYLRRNLF